MSSYSSVSSIILRQKITVFQKGSKKPKRPCVCIRGGGECPHSHQEADSAPRAPVSFIRTVLFFFLTILYTGVLLKNSFWKRNYSENKNKAPNPNDLFISCSHTMVFWISRKSSPVPNIPDSSPYYHNTLVLPLCTWVLVGPLFKTGERPGIQRRRSHGPLSQTCCGQREAV